MARLAQITQKSKFDISLQYIMKEVSDEVYFLHADEWESLLQSNTLISMGVVKHSQSFWNGKFAISLQNLEKEVRDL